MGLISGIASPQTLMKSNLEQKAETAGLDFTQKNQEKFSDVLVKQSKTKPGESKDQSIDRFRNPKIEKKPESEFEKLDAHDEPIKDDSSEVAKNPDANDKRLQSGDKPERSKTEREKAILKFMDSFESEFRIPPQQIVAAMAELRHDQMVQSPDETADAVMEKINLDEDQVSEAKQMYVGLLMQLHQIDQKSQAPSMDTMGQQTLLRPQVKERINANVQEKLERNQSLDALSNRFWMKDPNSAIPAKVAGKMPLEVPTSGMKNFDLQSQISDDNLSEDILPENQMHVPAMDPTALKELKIKAQIAPESLSPLEYKTLITQMRASLGNSVSKEASEAVGKMQTEIDPATGFVKEQPDALQFMVARPGGLSGKELTQKESQFQNQSQFQGQQESGFQKSSAKTGSGSLGTKKISVEEMNFNQLSSAMNPEMPLTAGNLKMPTLANSELALHTGQNNAPEANVRQIMNQAQYLIKNGGGEMKVQMTPEGLGHVDLKVQVIDGKVNVQMMTETKEAKTAIESSLADLKSSLSAQKLSVEHIKIDVVGRTNTENNSQSNMNFNSNTQRDSTRQFWNQFQDNFGNRSQRETYFDVSTKGYGTQRDHDPLQPIESSSLSRSVAGKGSGLNLVA